MKTDDWQVGVIVGRSGSGKTSIAKQLFPDAYIRGFEYTHKCVLDDFPEDLETGEITKALCSVGFRFVRLIGSKAMIALAKGKRCGLTLPVLSAWISL